MELNRDTINKIRGLILFTVITVIVGINYIKVLGLLAAAVNMAAPFILGAAIAFVLNVPMRRIESSLSCVLKKDSRLLRPVSMALSILLVAGVLFLVMFVVAPQLVRTLLGLQSSIPVFFGEVRQWLEKLFAENPQILTNMEQIQIDWQELFNDSLKFLKNGAGSMLDTTFSAAISIVNGMSTFPDRLYFFNLYSASERKSYQTDKKASGCFSAGENRRRDHTDRSFDFKDIFQFLYGSVCGSSDFRLYVFHCAYGAASALCAAHRRSDRIYCADSGIWGLYRLGSGSISDADYFSHGCPAVQCGIFHPPADRGKYDLSSCSGQFCRTAVYLGSGSRDSGRQYDGRGGNADLYSSVLCAVYPFAGYGE